MPTRDQRSPATVLETVSDPPNWANKYYNSRMFFGKKQEISSLNNDGVFIPGVLRLNPVVISRCTGTGVSGSVSTQNQFGIHYDLSGDIAGYCLMQYNWDTILATMTQWDATAASYSYTKAINKLSGADFDAGIILVELRETIEGLRHPLSAIRKYFKTANKRLKSRPEEAKRALDMLSGSWLEWRYGITPNIIAVESAIKLFKEKTSLLEGKLLRKRGKVAFSPAWRPDISSGFQLGYSYLHGLVDLSIEAETSTSIYYQFSQPVTWQERFGLDVLNFPSLLWEKIPLSFVGDWFLGIGQWLGSLHLSDKRIVCGSSTSQKTVVKASLPVVLCNYYNNVDLPTGSTASFVFEKLERRVNLSPPLLPVVNPASLSLQRSIDALTLIWQRLPKLRR